MSNDSIKLGVMPPLTGLVGLYGEEISNAAKIACAEVNENGGVLGKPLELIIEDDGSLPESAVSAAKKLVQQHHCVAIIGNLLSNSRISVAYQVAEPLKIPYLNFSFYEGSISSRYFFHFAALPNQQIDKMIPYMQKKYGPRMYFAGNNYEWPRGSIAAGIRALENSGGEVVGEEYFPIGVNQEELDKLLDDVAESKPDVFVPYFAGADQINLLTAFTARGLKKDMAVVMGHYDETMASHLPPEVREGFYSSNTYFMSVDTPENRQYLKKLGSMPGITGIYPNGNGTLSNFGEGTYLCVKAFAAAANKAKSTEPEALINALESISIDGPQGKVQMDSITHHAHVNSFLSRCQADGTFEIVEQFHVIEPQIPERYHHMHVDTQTSLEGGIRLKTRMIEQMAEAIFLTKVSDGGVVFNNLAAESMFGYNKNELQGKHFPEFIIESEKKSAEINHSLSHKSIWHEDLKTTRKDGSTFWCSITGTAFTHAEFGEVWMLVFNDINDRVTSRERLETYDEIVSATSDMLAQIDSNYTYLVANAAYCAAFNLRLEELVGHTVTELFGEDFFEQVIKPYADRTRLGETVRYQDWFEFPDTGRKYMDITYTPIMTDKRVYRGFVVNAHDITAIMLSEELLEASEKRFETIFEEAPLGIALIDSHSGRFYEVNPRFAAMAGRTREEMHTIDWMSITHPDDVKKSLDNMAVWNEGQVAGFVMEKRYIHPDGSVVWVNMTVAPTKTEYKSGPRHLCMIEDIDQRKKAEKELSASESKYETSIQALSEGIVFQLADGSIETCNRSAQHILGLTAEQMTGSTSLDLRRKSIHEDGSPFPGETHPMMHTLGTGETTSGVIMGIHRPEGELRWISINSNPLFHDGEKLPYAAVGSFTDITERKQAEENLRQANLIIERSPAVLFRWRAVEGWLVEYVSKNVTQFGYSVAELTSGETPYSSIMHPDDLERVGKEIERHSAAGETEFQQEYRLVSPQGDIYWVDDRTEVVQDAGGNVTHYTGIVVDITERKQAEQELSHFSQILEKSLNEIYTFDADTFRFIDVNLGAQKNLGYSLAELQSMTPVDIKPEFTTESFTELVKPLRANPEKQLAFTTVHQRKDKSRYPVDVYLQLLPNDDPPVFVAIVLDITERKLEQEALSKNIKDLEDQKYVLDHHAIVSRANIAGKITYVNEKFLEISGYSREELMGQDHRVINSNYHSAEFFEEMWRTIRNGKVWRGEICNKAKDGAYYWVESTIVPLLDQEGAVQEYVGVRTDITSRKRAEEQLRQTQKLEAISELTGGIAHDFNNLLGIILGNIKLVDRKIDPDSKIHNQLDRVARAASRGVVLTRQLLKFSHQTPEQHSPLNINDVLDNIRDLISKSLTAKVKVETSLAEDLWMVDIDEGSFEDAMINLSLNAGAAMAQGGELLFTTKNMDLNRRSVRREGSLKPGEYVCLEVKDTGTGMSADVLEKIFDPFFTTKDKIGGTGLGLAMVYGFIQRSNGHISAFSKPGKGSTFRIYLPRSANGASQFKASKLKKDKARGSLPRGTETILIVDDEKDLALIADDVLQELGYTTICASAGDEALHILAGNPNINLVFSDIVMPGMSGIVLADAVTEFYPEVKILLTSGYIGNKESRADAKSYGEILIKPYDDVELVRRIRESLDGT